MKKQYPEFIKSALSILIVFILISSCSMEPRGEFAWASTDDRGIEELEKMITHVDEYRMDVPHLHFYEHETVWWLFIIRSGRYDKEGFLAALYENNNTPQPVEVDLRQVYVEDVEGEKIIRQSYSPLPPGRYLLRLTHNSVIINEKDFIVKHSPGYVNYDEEFSGEDEKFDPIVKYSGL